LLIKFTLKQQQNNKEKELIKINFQQQKNNDKAAEKGDMM